MERRTSHGIERRMSHGAFNAAVARRRSSVGTFLGPGLEVFDEESGRETTPFPESRDEKDVEGKGRPAPLIIVEDTVWKYTGLTCALFAAICYSFSMLSKKTLSIKKYDTFCISVWCNQGLTMVVPFYAIYLRFVKKQMIFDALFEGRGKIILVLIVRGLIGSAALFLYVYSLKYLKLADATVITFSTPIAVTFFARVCLGEPCGVVPVIMAFVTLGGVVVLTRPPLLTGGEKFDDQILIGTLLAISCMLVLTSVFVILRYLRAIHFSIVIMAYGYVSTISGVIIAGSMGVLEFPRSGYDWGIAGFMAFITLLGQVFQTLSLKYEAAGPVALVRTLDIVFAFIQQLVFLGVYPDLISIIGASIVVFGIVVTTCRKWLGTLPEDHPTRLRFWFMLK